MANKPTKLQNLFEGRRRRASLNAWTHLRSSAPESKSRIKLELRLPLLNESLVGMNGPVSDAFTVMAKDDSTIERTNLGVHLEGMTLEFFATDGAKSPAVSSTGVKMLKLALIAAGEGEKRTIDLSITAYVPASIQLRDWAWEHLHADFHLEAVYSQSEMDFSGPADGEDDEDEDEEAEEPAAVSAKAPRAPRKSGPKELAEYHAAQKPN